MRTRSRFRTLRIATASGEILLRTNRGRLARGAPTMHGTPLVCVHGFGLSGIYMLPLAKQLARYAEVLIPDLPGYGASFRPGMPQGPIALADALVDLLDALRTPVADFLGNSYGCQVVAELAARHPRRVGKIVLAAPTVDPCHRNAPEQAIRLGLTALFEKCSLPPLVISHFLAAGPRTLLATLRHCLSHPMEATLAHISAPTLVVRGTRDFLVPQRWAEQAARLIPHGELIVLPGAAHGLTYSSPLKLAQAIAPFLEIPLSVMS